MTLAIFLDPVLLESDARGVVRVAQTRVTLDTVVTAFLEGCTPLEIVEQYPSLQLSDIYFVIGYYLKHRSEVDTYLAQRQRSAEEIQQEVEQRFNPIGIRDRLLKRRNQSNWLDMENENDNAREQKEVSNVQKNLFWVIFVATVGMTAYMAWKFSQTPSILTGIGLATITFNLIFLGRKVFSWK